MGAAAAPRQACLYVPALPLQLLAARVGQPLTAPLALLHGEAVGPQVAVWQANRAARAGGVVPGMRLSQARSLLPTLHADVLAATAVAAANATLATALTALSPYVAPDPAAPGTLWLDPNGLEALFAPPGPAAGPPGSPPQLGASLRRWQQAVVAAAAAAGLRARVVVGFNRQLVHALAAGGSGDRICADAAEERRLAAAVPLARLPLPAAAQAALARLGVDTLGALLALRGAALAPRLGAEVARLVHGATRADGAGQALPPPYRPPPPAQAGCAIEPADDDVARLLFGARRLLLPLLAALAARATACAGLTLTLEIGRRRPPQVLTVAPASPSRDAVLLLELLRLRLNSVQLPAAATHMTLAAQVAPAPLAQVALLAPGPGSGRPRPHAAAQGAWARLRAAFGPEAVTCARLRAVHVPEGRYRWEVAEPDLAARPVPPPALPPLQRQLLPRPLPLARAPAPGARLRGHGEVVAAVGPFRLEGGWWSPRPVDRDYHYVAVGDDTLLWTFRARRSGRWYLQGLVD